MTDDNVRHLSSPRQPWDVVVHAAPGARFVTPPEFLAGLRETTASHGLINGVVCRALAAAADDEGVLLDFDEQTLFDIHIAAELNADLEQHGEDVTPLVYDRFTAFALMDCLHALQSEGLLGCRGEGDTLDHRLTLP